MKEKKKIFEQHLHHDIEDYEKAEEYLETSLPLIGSIVMNFNSLENLLDSTICEIFTDRTDSIGLMVLHKMSYTAKVDLFKKFSDYFHSACEIEIAGYDELIADLRESGRLRNLAIHADWENTDDDGYTYVKLKVSQKGIEQEYVQFSEKSLQKIIDLIIATIDKLSDYWEERNRELHK